MMSVTENGKTYKERGERMSNINMITTMEMN